ncbi:hypothetical protein DHEL01_v207128 [Diaporthe helianthi]|uniref:Uncharacterized protein n=1 Tax=Diaporthe helianthi TaxID=158607 RepID=A0A2P5HW73_DIAHE|nr:hypothetical protein DHEL01_v207128 [Diaporthe helianthi]
MVKPEDIYFAMVETINAFFVDYNNAPHVGASVLSETLTKDCRRYLRPYAYTDALGLPRDFYFDNSAYEKNMTDELTVIQAGNWSLPFASVDVKYLKASAFSEYRVRLCGMDEYLLEVSWFWEFTEDGTKIWNMTQVVDPISMYNHFTEVQTLLAAGRTC